MGISILSIKHVSLQGHSNKAVARQLEGPTLGSMRPALITRGSVPSLWGHLGSCLLESISVPTCHCAPWSHNQQSSLPSLSTPTHHSELTSAPFLHGHFSESPVNYPVSWVFYCSLLVLPPSALPISYSQSVYLPNTAVWSTRPFVTWPSLLLCLISTHALPIPVQWCSPLHFCVQCNHRGQYWKHMFSASVTRNVPFRRPGVELGNLHLKQDPAGSHAAIPIRNTASSLTLLPPLTCTVLCASAQALLSLPHYPLRKFLSTLQTWLPRSFHCLWKTHPESTALSLVSLQWFMHHPPTSSICHTFCICAYNMYSAELKRLKV